MPARDTELMLRGYGLTTAEMFYRMPDYRNVLNSFTWQDYDLARIIRGCSISSRSGRKRSRARCTRSVSCTAGRSRPGNGATSRASLTCPERLRAPWNGI